MKNFILTALLICSATITTFGQTKENIAQHQLELEQKKASQLKASQLNTKPVYVSMEEYAKLKSQGLITNQQVKPTGKTSPKFVIKVHSSTEKTAANTPCDDIPYAGTVFGWTNISLVDDDATGTIALPFNFCYYGQTYTSCNISINGNIQFGTNSTGYTATGFPSNTVNMIAPFWADVDLNGIGTVKVDMYPTRMVVSWDSVGRYSAYTDKYNSFQCVITDGSDPILPPGKNVGFYYKKMQWATAGATGIGGTPTTVGVNAGNNIDFFLVGRFDQNGMAYDGPNGLTDGVTWLEGKRFYFNVCPPLGSNVEPYSSLIPPCKTFTVCGNDTMAVMETFNSPEASQTTSITAAATSLGSAFSYSTVTNANSTSVMVYVNGNLATGGLHTVTLTATDNGSPAQTSIQTFDIFVNQSAVSNLNGSIVVTPTLGACPGGVVSANVVTTGGTPDTYIWNNGATSAATSFTTIIPADSLIYVTIESSQCIKTIYGHITINPVPVASITGDLSFCNGDTSSTVLTATNTLNPGTQGPHAYVWASSAGVLTTDSAVAVGGGVYTVTVTNQYNCKSVASTTVTVNESPNYTITPKSVYCANEDSARLSIDYLISSNPACGLATSGCSISNTVAVGTGTTTTTNSTYPSAYANYWNDCHTQMLYKASELLAAGVTPGKLSSIAFNVSSLNTGVGPLPNYTIKLKCTGASSITTFDNAGLSTVYTSALYTPSVGINTHAFSQSYVWDGTSNILVDLCFNNIPWGDNASCYYTATPFTSVVYGYQTGTTGSSCGGTNVSGSNSNRLNAIFGNCSATQSPSQFNVTVTPTVGVVIPATKDSIIIDLPSILSNTCYTVTITNPIGNCVKTQTICLNTNVGTTTATLASNINTVCIGSPVTLTASGATTYTFSYLQGSAFVPLTTINTQTQVTHVPVQAGLNTYSLTAVGDCGAPAAGYTVGVFVTQLANLSITPFQDVVKCLNTPFTISAGVGSSSINNPGTPYTYNWTTLPGNLPAPGAGNTSTYTTNSNITTTLVVTVTGSCATTVSDDIVIQNFADNLSVSIIDSVSICSNSQFNLHANANGGRPAYNYSWFLVPSTNSIGSTSELTTMSPATEGVYMITVSVIDSCNYSDTDNQLIMVLPPCTIEIPNIITANGDGINDTFIIKNVEFHSNTSLTIFDRWGRMVYNNQDYKNEWKGEGLQDGTYFYIIDVPDDKKYNGFLTVFKGN